MGATDEPADIQHEHDDPAHRWSGDGAGGGNRALARAHPDSSGSYINGQWSTLADMSFWRRYYASGVLKDGRVFVCGGEQSGDVGDTNKGAIYDPGFDTWTNIASPPWTQVGDGASCVLPDGRIMIGALLSGACIIYDPATDSWSTTGAQPCRTNEETWILLPDNTIIAPQCFS